MKIGIIGCGIIGSYLGYKLAKEHDVTIFEKKKRIGGKACSGLISERIWNFIPEKRELILNTIDYVNIHFPRKNRRLLRNLGSRLYHKQIGAGKFAPRLYNKKISAEKNLSQLYDKTIKLIFKPKMFVFDRQKLDEYAADLAKKEGANIQLDAEVKRLFYVKNKKPSISVFHGKNMRRKNMPRLYNKTKVYEFDLIIGTDGANSVVRRQLGLKEPKYRMGIYTYRKDKKICTGKSIPCLYNKKFSAMKNFPRLYNYVDTYPTKNGFFWKIPRKNDVEYGLIGSAERANNDFNEFCKKFKVKKEKIFSALIPEGPIISNNDKIALCGDAAGLTKPWSGGGVIWGVSAANLLVENIDNIQRYNRRINIMFKYKIKKARLITKAAFFTGKNTIRLIPKEINYDSDWGM